MLAIAVEHVIGVDPIEPPRLFPEGEVCPHFREVRIFELVARLTPNGRQSCPTLR